MKLKRHISSNPNTALALSSLNHSTDFYRPPASGASIVAGVGSWSVCRRQAAKYFQKNNSIILVLHPLVLHACHHIRKTPETPKGARTELGQDNAAALHACHAYSQNVTNSKGCRCKDRVGPTPNSHTSPHLRRILQRPFHRECGVSSLVK